MGFNSYYFGDDFPEPPERDWDEIADIRRDNLQDEYEQEQQDNNISNF